jgi:hypothetical protein
MVLLAINILIIIVIGAIFFWVVERFVRDGRLANLLKILIVLVCLGAILVRVLPKLGAGAVMYRKPSPGPSLSRLRTRRLSSAAV